MKLTKEKCDKALEYARSHYYPPYAETMGLYEDFEVTEEYQVLEQLIKEHFDNPPLRLEDVVNVRYSELFPIWDNKYKRWCFVTYMLNSLVYLRYYDGYCEPVEPSEFEKNRFYRKKVEE